MIKKWPLGSIIAVITAIAIVAVEYGIYTLLSAASVPAWYEPASSIVRSADLSSAPIKWANGVSVSPDGTKQARTDAITDENNFHLARVVVEDRQTGQQLAYVSIIMPCRIAQGACRVDELAWVDSQTVAFNLVLDTGSENQESIMLWDWQTSRPHYDLFDRLGNILFLGLLLLALPVGLVIWAFRHAREVSYAA